MEVCPSAVNMAEDETGLARAVFPSDPSFTLEEALKMDWLPEQCRNTRQCDLYTSGASNRAGGNLLRFPHCK